MNMKKTASIVSRISLSAVTLFAFSSLALAQHAMHTAGHGDQSKLVQIVREATRQYLDVNNATADEYAPLFGCVSGSDHGAMGIHYVKKSLLNGTIDVNHPQALIYEPLSNGQLKLVGVEYIADQAIWLASNSAPPVLEGQVFLLVGYPNRFTIPAFFELHVWAWRDNPQGDFVDWNDHVSCAHQ
ncbi:MAG: hypothetical protein JOZ80_04890 [Acidobacteriaceae bacterium]|nr:hypothetical protein [Acidobacteriaceae bacterium]